MEEPLEQDRSITNDDLKPSSSSTATKSSRSSKQTTLSTTNGATRRHKRGRRQTNSTRSSSDHSSSSSRSSSTSSGQSSHSSIKNLPLNEQEWKKTRSVLAQEHLQTIVDKTKTGQFDILDGFAFISFETDDDWRIAFEHFHQQQLQQRNLSKRSALLAGKKNGSSLAEHADGHSLHRSISVPCKIEDGQRTHGTPTSAPADETSMDNHRPSMWQNRSPHRHSNELQSTATSIKSEPHDKTTRSSRTTSEHDENHFEPEHDGHSLKSNDDSKNESNDKKHHHHHHHHHHHKSHKRHKTKHDLTVNGDSSTKHPTITSMSDLAKQRIKTEPIPLSNAFPFPSHFDPKLFPLPSFAPFAPPSHPGPFPNPYDHSLMMANRYYSGHYPRDLPMLPPSRPPSRSLPHPFSMKDNHPDPSASMEKMFEKFYPGVLPSYLAAAASAAAAASSGNSNSPGSSLNMKMHGTPPTGPDHPLWPHREAFHRQFMAASNKRSSTKSPLFDSNTKPPSNHAGQSPSDRRHASSNSNTDLPNTGSTPTGHPLYLAPVIVTEFHQHQHNHNHTHEHKLNITTKDDRKSSSSPRSKTPLSNETKKPKGGFSVTDMFIDKTPPSKHSPQQQGFLSVTNKKDSNPNSSTTTITSSSSSSAAPLKKSFNGKWSTAHVHIAWMIFHHEQRQREKMNLPHTASKVRPSTTLMPPSAFPSQPSLLPPPLPLLDNNSDMGLLRPPPPSPFSFPFDLNSPHNPLYRPPSTAKLTRPTAAPSSSSSSSSSSMKPPSIKREQKTPFLDERSRRPSPPPLSRPPSGSNFLMTSPSHRMRTDFSSLLLPPPHHQMQGFSMNDDRKRFLSSNTDLMPPFGPPSGQSPFFSSLFPMGAPPMPPPMPSSSSSSSSRRNLGAHLTGNSDPSKSSLFPSSVSSPFDFTRSPLLPPGFPSPGNTLESDRFRFMLDQQARERDLQFAMMAAAANGSGPPPPLFADPNSSGMFKHY